MSGCSAAGWGDRLYRIRYVQCLLLQHPRTSSLLCMPLECRDRVRTTLLRCLPSDMSRHRINLRPINALQKTTSRRATTRTILETPGAMRKQKKRENKGVQVLKNSSQKKKKIYKVFRATLYRPYLDRSKLQKKGFCWEKGGGRGWGESPYCVGCISCSLRRFWYDVFLRITPCSPSLDKS